MEKPLQVCVSTLVSQATWSKGDRVGLGQEPVWSVFTRQFREQGPGNSYGMFQNVQIGSLLQQALRTVCISLPVPPVRAIPEGAN